jgi:hypothetical protein
MDLFDEHYKMELMMMMFGLIDLLVGYNKQLQQQQQH